VLVGGNDRIGVLIDVGAGGTVVAVGVGIRVGVDVGVNVGVVVLGVEFLSFLHSSKSNKSINSFFAVSASVNIAL
jgi:hypothetical protein